MRRPSLLGLALMAMTAWSAAAVAGDVTVAEIWARATPGNARSTTVYFRVEADRLDTLIGARSPVATTASLHADDSRADVMSMRALDGVALPPKQVVTFKPLGLHLMLTQLHAALREGDRFPLTLMFRKAGPVETEVTVLRPGAMRFETASPQR